MGLGSSVALSHWRDGPVTFSIAEKVTKKASRSKAITGAITICPKEYIATKKSMPTIE
jgi:hypothetical protein